MSYGLKYTGQFDSFKPLQSYRVDIYQKDFVGDETPILLSGTPVVQEWQDDDPKSPIRGCTLKVSIITDVNGVRLIDFYSEDDSQFYVEFVCTNTDQFLFKGFLMQDDCQEIQLDFNHEIGLTFTDMLGTLKDITINQAAEIVGTLTTISGVEFYDPGILANNTVASFDDRVGALKAGDTFTIFDGTNTYNLTCYNISYNIALGWLININEPCPFAGTITADFTYRIPYPLTGYIPLIDVLKLCVKPTKIETNFISLITIYPVSNVATERIFDDTFVDANTFFDGDNWMNCYEILEKLMLRFNASFFQAYGKWYAIRWDEMYRYTNTNGVTYKGQQYDNDFSFMFEIYNIENFDFYNGSDFETGVLKSINRPLQYVKESFNYVQPTDLLCNINLQNLGNLITEYDSGTYHIKEYELLDWYNYISAPYPKRFIRITIDNNSASDKYLQEIERIIVVMDSTYDTSRSVKSCDIYISKNSSINYSFSYKTNNSQPGTVTNVFAISLTDGVSTYYLKNDGSWSAGIGYSYSVLAGDNTNQWHDVNIKSNGVPFDGVINIYLAEATPNGTSSSSDETHYNNFAFTIYSFIDGVTNINGQTHTDTQTKQIKNNDSKEILFDNSPSWYIKGTLYTAEMDGLLRKKCVKWSYPGISYPYKNLGIATTQELMFTRFKPRAKYEGNLLFVKNGNGPYKFITPLSVFMKVGEKSLYRFILGKIAIDYKNANTDLTIYEHIDNMGGDFNGGIILEYLLWSAGIIYDFNYLFENK